MLTNTAPLGWARIVQLGLIQAALGSIVVLTTSTMNRVMVVELALPAMVPGFLVALHYIVQIVRPRFGYGSDLGGRCTPWIMRGMAVLALGAVGASASVALMATQRLLGIVLAVVAFVFIGLGVGAAGTSLLVLLAKRVEARRRAAAATITWFMMILGFIITSVIAGKFLDPFTTTRLVQVTACVAAAAFVMGLVGVWKTEGATAARAVLTPEAASRPAAASKSFAAALREIWEEPDCRQLTSFVFLSMVAYSAQDLILEPFAGTVFGFTPGESTKLSGLQNTGVLLGMLSVAILGTGVAGKMLGSLRTWTYWGCLASAVALLCLGAAGFVGPAWPLRPTVFALGLANGVFAVSALGSMMALAGAGRADREGVRMGLWGAAQAVAFAVGGIVGTVGVDLTRYLFGSPLLAYGIVFTCEAALFLAASALAPRDEATVRAELQAAGNNSGNQYSAS